MAAPEPGGRRDASPQVPAPLAQELIRSKRDGLVLDDAAIDAFVRGLVDASWSDAQCAAMAMAIFLRGLTTAETVALTRAMTRSGAVMDWSSAALPGPVLDKHSTGGVGDKVSLMLAPIVAACGGFVPMVSGRGLGHTGGTLDKMDSIPGYRTAPDPQRLRDALRSAGCVIMGQTDALAPADRRLYAIRDVTATVESIPLITASILSKKLAAGLQGLVLDVKVGNGAFAESPAMARALAQSLVSVAEGAGLPARAVLTDMNQVLGDSCGNALEVREALDYLRGTRRDARLHAVTRVLAADMLVLGRLAADATAALAQVDRCLADGSALERFARMVTALGGPSDFVERPGNYLVAAPVQLPVPAPRAGWVGRIATRDIGLLVIGLGGGRRVAADPVDHRVGFTAMAQPGQAVVAGAPLAVVHAATQHAAQQAASGLLAAVEIADAPPPPGGPLWMRLSGSTAN